MDQSHFTRSLRPCLAVGPTLTLTARVTGVLAMGLLAIGGLLGCAGSTSAPQSVTPEGNLTASAANSAGVSDAMRLNALFGEAGEDAAAVSDILFWSPEQQRVGYQSIAALRATRPLTPGSMVYPLVEGAAKSNPAIAALEALRFAVGEQSMSLADYMAADKVGGLLVLQGNQILFERYGLENTKDSLWISFSVAKSVTSMLVGAALKDGYIQSLDEPVSRYLPRLAGGAYDQSSIRDLLRMSSGVDWNEDYSDPKSDVSIAGGMDGLALVDYLAKLPRKHESGTTFNYSTGETNLMGAVLRAAIGNNLATYASTKIWQGFGMESEANWVLNEEGGVELGGCCINATLRDYGRIGRFVIEEKRGRGADSVLPEGWIDESTQPSPGYAGYGYFWWLDEQGEGTFAALGVFGQMIFIDPEHDIVIVTHSAWPKAVGDELGARRRAMRNAIVEAIKK